MCTTLRLFKLVPVFSNSTPQSVYAISDSLVKLKTLTMIISLVEKEGGPYQDLLHPPFLYTFNNKKRSLGFGELPYRRDRHRGTVDREGKEIGSCVVE